MHRTRRPFLALAAAAALSFLSSPSFATNPYTQIGGSLAGYVGNGAVIGAGNASASNTRPGRAVATGDSLGAIDISGCTVCGTGLRVTGETMNTSTTETAGRGRAAGNAAGAFTGNVVGVRVEGALSAGRGRRH